MQWFWRPLLLPSPAFAELRSEKIFLCYSPGVGCSALKFINFSKGFVSVNVSPGNHDEGSIDLKMEFTNNSRCKVDIDGTILRGDRAVAVLDWGLVSLPPGEKSKGHRQVNGLRGMSASEDGLNLSLTVSTHDCK